MTVKFRHLLELPTMNDLKAKTHRAWVEFHKLQAEVHGDCIPVKSFEQELVEHGNPENEATWRSFYAAITAKSLCESLEDPQYLIEFHLVYASQKWGWRDLLPNVLEEMSKIPEAVEAIVDGLESINANGCEYGTTPAEIQSFRELLINGNSEEGRRRIAA